MSQNESTQITPKQLCENLRVPDCVKELPTFSGSPEDLHNFINAVDTVRGIFPDCINGDENPYTKLINISIRNKITGYANKILASYGIVTSWQEIKYHLIANFADERDQASLITDLNNLSQNRLSVKDFYNRIASIRTLLVNYVNLHENNRETIKAQIDLYHQISLKSFMAGLNEPLGAHVRAMRPQTLQEALQACISENNIQRLKQNREINQYSSSNTFYQNNGQNFYNNSPKKFNNYNNYQNMSRNTRNFNESTTKNVNQNRNFKNMNLNPRFNNSQFPQNSGNFRRNNSGNFRNNRESRYEPMDIDSNSYNVNTKRSGNFKYEPIEIDTAHMENRKYTSFNNRYEIPHENFREGQKRDKLK